MQEPLREANALFRNPASCKQLRHSIRHLPSSAHVHKYLSTCSCSAPATRMSPPLVSIYTDIRWTTANTRLQPACLTIPLDRLTSTLRSMRHEQKMRSSSLTSLEKSLRSRLCSKLSCVFALRRVSIIFKRCYLSSCVLSRFADGFLPRQLLCQVDRSPCHARCSSRLVIRY